MTDIECRDTILKSMVLNQIKKVEDIVRESGLEVESVRLHLTAMEKEKQIAYVEESGEISDTDDMFDNPATEGNYVKLTAIGKIARDSGYEKWKEIYPDSDEKLAFYTGKFVLMLQRYEKREFFLKILALLGVIATAFATIVLAIK